MNPGPAAPAAPALTAGETIRRSDRRLGVLMLAPALIYIALLVAIPFLLALVLSLTNSSAGSLEFSFVGLQNFKNVVASAVFRRALWNTFVFTFASPPTGLGFAKLPARRV